VSVRSTDLARAVARHEQTLALTREAGDRRGAGRALNNLGMVALYQCQDDRAWRLYEEALAIMREIGDAFAINVVLNNLGIVAVPRRDLDRAAAFATECLEGYRELGDEQGVGCALINLAEVAHLQATSLGRRRSTRRRGSGYRIWAMTAPWPRRARAWRRWRSSKETARGPRRSSG
jgi:hypothetical protein